jgi:hypothetical protein
MFALLCAVRIGNYRTSLDGAASFNVNFSTIKAQCMRSSQGCFTVIAGWPTRLARIAARLAKGEPRGELGRPSRAAILGRCRQSSA